MGERNRRAMALATIFSLLALIVILGRAAMAAPGSEELAAVGATQMGSARTLAATVVVTSTADSGPGTLRQALLDAQASDTILFDTVVFVPTSPVTISLTSGPLPDITQGNLTIDGSNAGVILDGRALSNVSGFHITSDGNVIQGLRILRFPEAGVVIDGGARHNLVGGDVASERNVISGNGGDGVFISGSGTTSNTVSGNYIGVSISGTEALPNGVHGVEITNGAGHNQIGGDTPGERNLISGNTYFGVGIYGASTGNVVSGNYIGTDVSGTSALGNGYEGISINDGSSENIIGGNNASPGGICSGECNLISGNGREGVWMGQSGTLRNTISGNYIGTDVSGTTVIGNERSGIHIDEGGSYSLIGGDTPEQRNLISGNATGVSMGGSGTMSNTVSGNYIGTDASGEGTLPNTGAGVFISDASHNHIGGQAPEKRNVISGNDTEGVVIRGSDAVNNTISRNSIHNNGGRGIDLGAGGNLELPAPVISSIDLGAGIVSGTACAACTIEIFSDDEDEGRVYEGSTTAGAHGDWSFTKGSPLMGPHVTTTATDPQGNTSEFSMVPFIRVNRSHNWVDGQTPLPNTVVEAAVVDHEGNIKGTGFALSDGGRWFWTDIRDAHDEGVDIIAGDLVSVTIAAGLVITAEVVPMSGDVDIGADTVAGSIPDASEGQQVRAEIWDLSYSADTEGAVQDGGSYALHFQDFDIRDGDMVAVWYRNDEGNYVGIVRHWLRIHTRAGGSGVWGETMPGASVQITVARGGVVGTGVATADEEGNYGTDIYHDTEPITIVAGDTIAMMADGRSTTMTVETLTGVMDFYADTICGIAPPASEVRIDLLGGPSAWHSVDTAGHYCAELDFDLQPGDQGEVMVFDERGHRTEALLTYGERQVRPLSLEEPLQDAVASLVYKDYAVQVGAGEDLRVEVTPLDGIGQIWLYGRRDDLPSRAQYDLRTTVPTAREAYELLISPTRQGTYYFSVFGWEISGQQGTYLIVARTVADRYLSDMQPRSAGNTGAVTLNVEGFGFVEGMRMELRRPSHATLAADSVRQSSSTAVSAHFDLRGAAPGLYDAAVIWPDAAEETLEQAFEVNAGGIGPRLEASLEAPEFVRPDRSFVLWLDYANTGDADMVAPLFIVSSTQGVPMRLAGEEPFEDRAPQVLGIDSEGLAGNVSPGASGRIPIYFHVPPGTGGHEMLDFGLKIMISDTLPIDWGEVEVEIRPPDVDPEVWNVLWPFLTAQIGDSWGDYRQILADNASYLSTLGRTVYSVRELFRFEVRKALGMNPRTALAARLDAYAPAPGMPLQFGRVFPGSLEGRFYLGPMGRGWSHSYDVYLEEQSGADILLHWPGSFTRLFRSNGDGTYSALPGDHGKLTRDGDTFELAEKDGTVCRFWADGRLDYVEEPNGNRIAALYDGSGRLVEIQHSSGASFALEYNAQGRISRLADHTGRVTEYGYDATGEHLLTATAPGGRVTTYTYNPVTGQPADHALLSIAYPDGTHQTYAYEELGRLSEEHLDGGAERVTYTYDAFGRIHVTDATGETTIVSPDEGGRLGKVRDALGNELSQEHDPMLNLSQVTDTAGQPYTFGYDLQGNVIAAENPLGQRVVLGYDTRFSLIDSLEDARGNRTTFDYDDAGNLATVTYPDGSQESFAYDGAGNLTGHTSRSGDAIAYSYNARGQLLRRDYPDGSWMAYTYDPAGNRTTASDPRGTIIMTYDADSNLLTSILYPSGHSFEFSYNDAGQRTQRLDQDGRELNYDYDVAGRLSGLSDENGTTIIAYEYDDNGRLSRETKGNGTYTSYAYDGAGQLLSMVNCAPDDSVQSRFDYSYDANGNRTSMTTLEGTTSYEYDLIGQLTGVTYPDGRHVVYAYDPAGNRVTVTDDGATTAYATNELNQYTQVGDATYTYDGNGNMTSKTGASGTTTYEYDFENRLVRVTTPMSGTWEYTYDALGNRVAVAHGGVVTRYVHDPIGLVDVAAEYDGSGALVARYVHGLGLVARIDGTGDAGYYGFDGTGNTRQLTDDLGAITNAYDYSPFGVPLQTNEALPNPFGYVGRYGVMSEGYGFHFMRARYYPATLGRFFSPDPTGVAGGPNLYTYCLNNPINRVDPTGQDYDPPSWDEIRCDAGLDYTMNLAGLGPGWKYVRVGLATKTYVSNLKNAESLADVSHATGVFVAKVWLTKLGVPYGGRIVDAYDRLTYDLAYWWFTRNLPDSPTSPTDTTTTENITSDDPNEKVGPAGFGEQRLVAPDDELDYVVYFENKPEAGAPAQEVFVTDYLDPGLDWSTFRLTEIAWGDHIIAIPKDTADFHTRRTVEDYREEVEKSWWVDVEVELDYATGGVRWTFRTLDPLTGELPLDPLAGFLPPNDATHRGEGYVAFTIRPRTDSPDGTILSNQATIVFDTNEPIVTNEVWNTIGEPCPSCTVWVPCVLKD